MMSTQTGENSLPLERFRIRFRNGDCWIVEAATYQRQFHPEDLVHFQDAHGAKIEKIFLRGDDVSAIAPDGELEITGPVLALQHDVKVLTNRLDNLENNLGSIVTSAVNAAVISAVNAAFTQRGF